MNIVTHPCSSSSSSKTRFALFCLCRKHNSNSINISKVSLKIPTKTVPTIPASTKQASPIIDQKPLSAEPQTNRNESAGFSEGTLVARRPVFVDSGENDGEKMSSSSGILDVGLEEFVKKMSIFEPKRVESSATSQEKPLFVNLDLALYRARQLDRKFRYEEAEEILKKCISYWPEDGRAYVALGKTLSKQSKWEEARAWYEKGCQATQGENSYIWQCWAVLEVRVGNLRRARELFDAATVANVRHIAAWHGWAVLELKQGNVKKARQLLAKALKFCGGNHYVYQTLALLEAKANRLKQARYFFKHAIRCNPRSCACWLAWAQVEMRQGNNLTAAKLFEKAVQVSPKNRYTWHVWGLFEENLGNIEKARKLLKIGHVLNPRDPVLLQSLALLEYKHSTANLARVLFRRASELYPRDQAVSFAWGWMEWKEGNIPTARKLYQRVLEIDTNSETAARCMQSWGVLEQRAGNISAARRLFRSSLNVDSQSHVTWMTWAQLEEEQGNSVRAEEIRNLYFQQRTEVVDDATWIFGLMDIVNPAVDTVKRFLKLDQNPSRNPQDPLRNTSESNDSNGEDNAIAPTPTPSSSNNSAESITGFDLDSFVKERFSLDTTKLDDQLHKPLNPAPWRPKLTRKA